ncbi:unnamed protein product [Parascedosporium putredinis]|uniref:Zn(2)-C6 fungal-type domain-containing protein n=1 Tax=Parascedosporium putredinis TaxID=1442378 RepID=A0A9P1HAB6_9PEZI|nr:unnamed protein product [Parascedosporium putredinis]CAI8002493.1 unnamed protein product [Parascedosporium putredinis]
MTDHAQTRQMERQGEDAGTRVSPPQSAENGLKIWSCVICRRRKVKCDRSDPCANCVRAGIDCHFPVTGRIPKRSRDPAAWRTPAQKQAELISRLRRLETVVTELTAQVEEETGRRVTHVEPEPLDPQPGSEFDEDFGRLVVDKDGGLHVGNRFWTVFCDEVDNILQAVHDVADSSSQPSYTPTIQDSLSEGTSSRNDEFIFGMRDSEENLDALNPLPSQVLFIWSIFTENVDPFIKVLHVPTIDRIVRDLSGGFSSLGTPFEALMFSICFASINSMDEVSVSASFGQTKAELMARYRLGAEKALGRGKLLTTKDTTLFQASVIYVSVLPYIGDAASTGSPDHILELSLIIIRCSHALKTEPTWAKWRWQTQGTAPWHALTIFVRHACSHPYPWSTEMEQTWEKAKELMALVEGQETIHSKRLLELAAQLDRSRGAEVAHPAAPPPMGPAPGAIREWTSICKTESFPSPYL